MKRVNVRFEEQEELRDIDVLFSASEEDEQLRTLMDRVGDPFAAMWKVVDATGASVTMSEERIAYLVTDNKRLRVESEDGTYWLKATMQIAEQNLNPSAFLRISRYEIINLRKVRRFDFSNSGMLSVEMEDGTRLWASRRFIPIIRERLQKRGW